MLQLIHKRWRCLLFNVRFTNCPEFTWIVFHFIKNHTVDIDGFISFFLQCLSECESDWPHCTNKSVRCNLSTILWRMEKLDNIEDQWSARDRRKPKKIRCASRKQMFHCSHMRVWLMKRCWSMVICNYWHHWQWWSLIDPPFEPFNRMTLNWQ